jgi:hypothetical protein
LSYVITLHSRIEEPGSRCALRSCRRRMIAWDLGCGAELRSSSGSPYNNNNCGLWDDALIAMVTMTRRLLYARCVMQTWVHVRKGYSIRTRKSEQVRILACVRYVHVEKQPEIATEEPARRIANRNSWQRPPGTHRQKKPQTLGVVEALIRVSNSSLRKVALAIT